MIKRQNRKKQKKMNRKIKIDAVLWFQCYDLLDIGGVGNEVVGLNFL